jgi:CubicO group peptidase (beta-lactamase class C family)
MNCKTLILCLLLPLLCGNSLGQNRSSISKRLDSLFSALTVQNQFSGSVLIAEKGKVLYKGGKGLRDELTREPNNAQTVFELASCSKQFTGVAIALLHREGKIDYNADITRYLPELNHFKGVTIYNLLRHTSGVPECLAGFRKDWKNDRIATNKDVIDYYAIRKDTLEFQPDSRYRYCNTNYALLATIIERVSGQDIGTYLSEKIFKPLKMDRTFIYNRRLSPREISNYAYGYVWLKNSFEKATEDDEKSGGARMSYYMDGIVGNAKVNSTVEDLYKWISALKSDQLLTRQEFNEVMATSYTSNNKAVSYGFGFEVRKKDDSILSYGHTGCWDGYITFIYYNVAKDRTVIVLNNFEKGVCPYDNIAEILDNKPSSNRLPKKVDLPAPSISKYAGEYIDPESPSTKHTLTYLDKHLIYNTNEVNWDMRFFPISENSFQAIRQGGADGVIKFTLQSDGTIALEMTQYGQIVGKGIRKP